MVVVVVSFSFVLGTNGRMQPVAMAPKNHYCRDYGVGHLDGVAFGISWHRHNQVDLAKPRQDTEKPEKPEKMYTKCPSFR